MESSIGGKLQLHNIPHKNVYVDHINEEVYTTLTALPRKDQTPLTFRVPSIKDAFLDVSHCYIKFKIKVLKQSDGAALTEAESNTVSPINFLGATFFKNVEIFYENTLVWDSENFYPFISYLAVLLYASKEAKDTYLTNALYYQDTAGSKQHTCVLLYNSMCFVIIF